MQRDRAFTLVELLVVIGIISALIAILLPALNKAREAANSIACASNMRQVAMAALMYANENDGRVPPAYYKDAPRYSFFSLLAPSLGVGYYPADNAPHPTVEHSAFQCPVDTAARAAFRETYHEGGPCSYAVNGHISDIYLSPTDTGGSIFGGKSHGTVKLSQIRMPSETIMLVENHNPNQWNVYGYGDIATVKLYKYMMTYAYTGSLLTYANDQGKQGYHAGRNNWAFMDGHVASLTWMQTLSPENLWEVDPSQKAIAYIPPTAYRP